MSSCQTDFIALPEQFTQLSRSNWHYGHNRLHHISKAKSQLNCYDFIGNYLFKDRWSGPSRQRNAIKCARYSEVSTHLMLSKAWWCEKWNERIQVDQPFWMWLLYRWFLWYPFAHGLFRLQIVKVMYGTEMFIFPFDVKQFDFLLTRKEGADGKSAHFKVCDNVFSPLLVNWIVNWCRTIA